MRKYFITICFAIAALATFDCFASITEFRDINTAKANVERAPKKALEDPDVPTNPREMGGYIKERLKETIITRDDGNDSSMNIEHSEEYIKSQEEGKKSTFDKIYESAIGRVNNTPQPLQPKAVQKNQNRQAQKKEWEKPNFETLSVELPPFGDKVVVPAKEHIPYLFTSIDVLEDGLININETVVVVANGQKLKKGISRAIPKMSTSRSGETNRIDLTLAQVTINDEIVSYKLVETDEAIILTPASDFELKPGVYTYQFNYVVDRRLWYYDDFNEFYWDVTGSSWRLVVARAGASLSLPGNMKILGHDFLLGYYSQLSRQNTLVTVDPNGTVGFISERPLFVGEGMHMLVSLPKQGFIEPGISKKFTWFVNDHGAMLFSLFALVAIVLGYFISWKTLNKKGYKQKVSLKKNASMLRYLTLGVFDKVSFGAFILEMFKKNLIDIQKEGDNISLVKKSDNVASLSRLEKKAMSNLFLNRESVLNVSKHNSLKLKRAFEIIKDDTVGRFKNFTLILNFGYLGFSVLMLLFSEICVAMISVEKAIVMSAFLLCDVIFALCIFYIGREFKSKKMGYAVKAMSLIMAGLCLFIGSVFISFTSAIMVLITIYVIFSYTELFAKRSGLVKGHVVEANEFKNFIMKSKENILLGKEFLNQQANIFALGLTSEFPENKNTKDYYRIDMVEELVKYI